MQLVPFCTLYYGPGALDHMLHAAFVFSHWNASRVYLTISKDQIILSCRLFGHRLVLGHWVKNCSSIRMHGYITGAQRSHESLTLQLSLCSWSAASLRILVRWVSVLCWRAAIRPSYPSWICSEQVAKWTIRTMLIYKINTPNHSHCSANGCSSTSMIPNLRRCCCVLLLKLQASCYEPWAVVQFHGEFNPIISNNTNKCSSTIPDNKPSVFYTVEGNLIPPWSSHQCQAGAQF